VHSDHVAKAKMKQHATWKMEQENMHDRRQAEALQEEWGNREEWGVGATQECLQECGVEAECGVGARVW
jgi:hypothetical protein